MYKLNFLLFSLLCTSLAASAQRQNTYFIKNNGQYVTERDSADYIRHVIEPEQGSELYRVKENYLDGTLKSSGLSSKIDPPLYEGVRTTYFPNGNTKEIASFIKGQRTDTAFSYYPNNKLFSKKVYIIQKEQPKLTSLTEPIIQILSIKDSTGKDLVTNGNGEYIDYDADFKEITERGPVKNGLQDGIWTGKTKGSFSKYTETYADGKLISGESIDENSFSYKYTTVYMQPVYKGGMKKFYNYLANHIKYPASCSKAGIQGVALMKFVIEKDGTLVEVKVANIIHPDLAAEAIKVMKESPKWQPGMIRGKPVRVAYNIPLSFHL